MAAKKKAKSNKGKQGGTNVSKNKAKEQEEKVAPKATEPVVEETVGGEMADLGFIQDNPPTASAPPVEETLPAELPTEPEESDKQQDNVPDEVEKSAGGVRVAEEGKVAVAPTAMDQFEELIATRDEYYNKRGMSTADIEVLETNMANIIVLVHSTGTSEILSAYRKFMFKRFNRVGNFNDALAKRGYPSSVYRSMLAMQSVMMALTTAERLGRKIEINQSILSEVTNDGARRYISNM